jgi:type I restriction-modification system DNA methylase subunit
VKDALTPSEKAFLPVYMETGFDIVIGNPPYVQLQKAVGANRKYADLYKNQNYKTFDRTGDIYCLFYEKGITLLCDGGHLAFITSNKWMRAGYGEKLRQFFNSYNPKILIDLGPGVFENATVDTNILIIQKAKNQHRLHAVTINEKKKDNIDFSTLLEQNGVILQNLSGDAWFIGSDAEQRLKEKIERIGKPLKKWDVNIYRGILTGLNEAFIIDDARRKEILDNCKDEDERRRTEAIIKPILRGRDIKRYYYEWAGLWMMGTFPALKLNIENYPAIKKYFLEHFDIRQLEQSGNKYPEIGFDARKKTGNKWFETQDQIAYYPEFEKEKVVYSEIVRSPQFYDTDKFYIEATSFLMTGENIKYICGLLNSNPVNYFFRIYYSGGGLGKEGYRYKKAFLENLPIPPITPATEPIVSQIELLVDTILVAKKENPQADTSDWEREIDRLVYKLYELTEEEKKIIERGNNEK